MSRRAWAKERASDRETPGAKRTATHRAVQKQKKKRTSSADAQKRGAPADAHGEAGLINDGDDSRDEGTPQNASWPRSRTYSTCISRWGS